MGYEDTTGAMTDPQEIEAIAVTRISESSDILHQGGAFRLNPPPHAVSSSKARELDTIPGNTLVNINSSKQPIQGKIIPLVKTQ